MSSRLATIRGAIAAVLLAAGLGAARAQAPLAPAITRTANTAAQGANTPAAAPAPPNSAAAVLAEDIRDIRGPKYILPAWFWPALIGAAVLLGAACYGVWRWLRRRRRPRPLLPFEAALQRLEEIRALMQPASAREFSIAVSDIVRRYIEQRFEVTATHQTTEEFLRDLLESSNPALARHRSLLSEFLYQCDLVKFAGMSLSLRGMESLHDSARAFVLETAKPEAPAADANANANATAKSGQPAAGDPAAQTSGRA